MNINDTFPKETIMGVYKIENTENHKVYIGSSKNIYDRWKQHLRKLKKNKHHSFKLQSEYNMANDKTIFDFEIIVVVKEYKLLKPIEELCINKFNSYYNGYNCCEKADNPKYAHIKKKPVKLIPSSEKFIWVIQNRSMDNFKEITSSDTTRILFLSTYLGYDGYLMFNRKTPMSKSNMCTLLKLSKREFQYFYKELVNNNILELKNEKLYINQDIFGKGNLSNNKVAKLIQQDKSITRLYIDGVRELYNKSTSTSHKTLSYIFQILPYVNRQYNIICFNPLENNLDNIKCMSLGEFCNIISYNSHNIRRLQRNLFEPTFNIHGRTTNAICCVSKSLNNSDCRIFINPMVYYAGDKWQEVEILGNF